MTERLLFALLCFLLHFSQLNAVVKSKNQCLYVREDEFNECANKRLSYQDLVRSTNEGKDECINEAICRHEFKITFVQQMYNLQIFDVFSKMLAHCCGRCASYKVANILKHLNEVDDAVLKVSDIIFPVFGTKPTKDLHGFHFVPIYEAPSAYYFSRRTSGLVKLGDLVLGILSAWPLIVICLLLAALSGFIVWLLEKKVNRGEFPKPFFQGISEGFWWSFISMTTVGYGDKTPRSFQGRVYATLWILVGITIFSILTGSLTQQIADVHASSSPLLHGKKVGGLKTGLVEATIVAQHGGFFESIDSTDTIENIMELFVLLDEERIDGIILSRPTYYFFLEKLKKEKYRMFVERLETIKTDMTEKALVRGKLVLGALMRDTKSYTYFQKYLKTNWLQIQVCNAFNLNYKAQQSESSGSSSFGVESSYIIYVLMFILLLIMSIGWCYEKKHHSKNSVEQRYTGTDDDAGPSGANFTSEKVFM